MENSSCPRIEHAYAVEDGVLVYFDDGKVALYPASLLHSMLPAAVEIKADSEED